MLRVIVILISVPLGALLVLVALLFTLSPGTIKPFLDAGGKPLTGSISEKIQVNINGVEQGMIIKGKDINNPVLLFLHGGTAMPEYFLIRKYPTGLDEYFTVCWWDRRGAGLSYRSDTPPESMDGAAT